MIYKSLLDVIKRIQCSIAPTCLSCLIVLLMPTLQSSITTLPNANFAIQAAQPPVHAEYFPSWSPDGRFIIYSSDENNQCSIYVANSDGTNPHSVLNVGECDRPLRPILSPDGSKFVYANNTQFVASRLWIVDIDGTNLHEVGVSGELTNPVWSPEGKHIAFHVETKHVTQLINQGIYIVDADGSKPKQLNALPIDEPAWSPDGKHIAAAQGGLIGIMDPDGTNFSGLIKGDYPFAWSRDSKQIAYTATVVYVGAQLNIVNVDRSDNVQLTKDRANNIRPVWSPNGKEIMFFSIPIKGDIGDSRICLINSDGSNEHCIWQAKNPNSASWSPDGKLILFASDSSGVSTVYLMNADGTNLRTLLTGQNMVLSF